MSRISTRIGVAAHPLGHDPFFAGEDRRSGVLGDRVELSEVIEVSEINGIAFAWGNRNVCLGKDGFPAAFDVIEIYQECRRALSAANEMSGVPRLVRWKVVEMGTVLAPTPYRRICSPSPFSTGQFIRAEIRRSSRSIKGF